MVRGGCAGGQGRVTDERTSVKGYITGTRIATAAIAIQVEIQNINVEIFYPSLK